MSEMKEWAVGDHVHGRLVDTHGYELVDEVLWVFRKVLDGQHAALVTADPTGGNRACFLQLGYARRDINELVWQLQGVLGDPWRRTAKFMFDESEAPFPEFSGYPELPLLSTPEAVTEWMERWLPKFEARLGLDEVVAELRAQIDDAPPARVDARRRGRILPLMANQMLSGWRGAPDEQEYFTHLERWEAEGGSTQPMYRRLLDNAVAWIAEHPNGVDRELAG